MTHFHRFLDKEQTVGGCCESFTVSKGGMALISVENLYEPVKSKTVYQSDLIYSVLPVNIYSFHTKEVGGSEWV
jgi:hypothetical protein